MITMRANWKLVLVALWGTALPVMAQTGPVAEQAQVDKTGKKTESPQIKKEVGGSVVGQVRVEKARVLTTGPKSDGDVVVFLTPLTKRPHAPPAGRIEMDQRGMVFIPHVMTAQVGQEVAFLNSDNDRHNVFFLFEETGKTLDIGTWGPGQTVTHTFTKAGEVITLCQLHLEMAAYILVFDHPFHTTAKIQEKTQTASFRLDKIPPGDYLLSAWHKKLRLKTKPIPVSVELDKSVTKNLVITKRKYAEAE